MIMCIKCEVGYENIQLGPTITGKKPNDFPNKPIFKQIFIKN